MRTYDLPKTFYADHVSRCGDNGHTIVKELARTVRVQLTDEALAELRSDADYYADPSTREQFDPATDGWLIGVHLSAKATLRRLAG